MTEGTQPSLAPLLRTVSASKKYRGFAALSDVSIDVRHGEILGVIGPNGAGKTTLFNVIAGSTSLTSGRVEFRGRNVSGKPPHKRARMGIARTFQLVKPFVSLTMFDNIVVGGTGGGLTQRRAQARAEELVEQFSFGRQAHQLAGTLNAVEGKRLEVARALATDPQLILLDEIFSGLNADEVVELGELVRALPASGPTVLLIEHNVGAIRRVTERVVALSAGVVIAEGTPGEVFSNSQVVESYLGKRAQHS